jgi:hypothetical protein
MTTERPPTRSGAATLAGLALSLSRRLETTRTADRGRGGRQAHAVRLVPVQGGTDDWLLVRSPLLSRLPQTFSLPAADATLDFALRVDLLLRWILPPVPSGVGPRRPGEQAALRVAFASPLALLVLRGGAPTAGDSDIAWWQAFGQACGVVGRRPATALAVTPAGVVEIPAARDVLRDAG